jgi:primase-polymerase (primpol)-like protein
MVRKPRTLKGDPAHLPPALAPMTALDHWVLWRWELRKGIWTKPPFVAASPATLAKNNDPATWRPYKTVVAAVQNGSSFDGIGFALLDTLFDVVDLDHCLDPATGQPDTWAQIWLEEADAAYIERTPSGEGLRIIGAACTGESLHRKWPIKEAREKAAIEIYRNTARYITVTGIQVGDCKKLLQIDLLDQIKAHYDSTHQDERRTAADSISTALAPRSITTKSYRTARQPAPMQVRSFTALSDISAPKACRSTRSPRRSQSGRTESVSDMPDDCGRRSSAHSKSGKPSAEYDRTRARRSRTRRTSGTA